MRRMPGMGRLEGVAVMVLQREVRELREALAAFQRTQPPSWESVAAKLSVGANVSRAEAAVYLQISTRQLQRMDDPKSESRTLDRCPGLGRVVRYAARDVLRLASASSKKGA